MLWHAKWQFPVPTWLSDNCKVKCFKMISTCVYSVVFKRSYMVLLSPWGLNSSCLPLWSGGLPHLERPHQWHCLCQRLDSPCAAVAVDATPGRVKEVCTTYHNLLSLQNVYPTNHIPPTSLGQSVTLFKRSGASWHIAIWLCHLVAEEQSTPRLKTRVLSFPYDFSV